MEEVYLQIIENILLEVFVGHFDVAELVVGGNRSESLSRRPAKVVEACASFVRKPFRFECNVETVKGNTTGDVVMSKGEELMVRARVRRA